MTFCFEWAIDKEGNYSQTYRHNIHIDKTPPQTTYSISPLPDEDGWIYELPVTVSFSASDNLSGVSFTTEDVIINENGEHQIDYHSRDLAGNTEETKTLTVRIDVSEQDTTPPEISLELIPTKLKLPIKERIKCLFTKFYKLVYSAADEESGIKEIKAGLIMPDITNFKVKISKGKRLRITINEKKKLVIIYASNPQEIAAQLKEKLFLIKNNQPLRLKLKSKSRKWRIEKRKKFLRITAPSIIFKAEAADNAGNTSSEHLEYKRRKWR